MELPLELKGQQKWNSFLGGPGVSWSPWGTASLRVGLLSRGGGGTLFGGAVYPEDGCLTLGGLYPRGAPNCSASEQIKTESCTNNVSLNLEVLVLYLCVSLCF